MAVSQTLLVQSFGLKGEELAPLLFFVSSLQPLTIGTTAQNTSSTETFEGNYSRRYSKLTSNMILIFQP